MSSLENARKAVGLALDDANRNNDEAQSAILYIAALALNEASIIKARKAQ